MRWRCSIEVFRFSTRSLWAEGLGAAATIFGVAPLTAAATHLSFLKENVMSEQPRPYEPLTSENAALIL
ncbi:MAG: hypothetical protein WAV38_24600, partial [Xanthobacteraceae bacterium]